MSILQTMKTQEKIIFLHQIGCNVPPTLMRFGFIFGKINKYVTLKTSEMAGGEKRGDVGIPAAPSSGDFCAPTSGVGPLSAHFLQLLQIHMLAKELRLSTATRKKKMK